MSRRPLEDPEHSFIRISSHTISCIIPNRDRKRTASNRVRSTRINNQRYLCSMFEVETEFLPSTLLTTRCGSPHHFPPPHLPNYSHPCKRCKTPHQFSQWLSCLSQPQISLKTYYSVTSYITFAYLFLLPPHPDSKT